MFALTKLLSLTKWVDAPARVLMSLLFLVSGVGKLAGVAPTQAFMEHYGVPGVLISTSTVKLMSPNVDVR